MEELILKKVKIVMADGYIKYGILNKIEDGFLYISYLQKEGSEIIAVRSIVSIKEM